MRVRVPPRAPVSNAIIQANMGLLNKPIREVGTLECPPGWEPHCEYVFYVEPADETIPYSPDLSDIHEGESLEAAAERQMAKFLNDALREALKATQNNPK